MFHAIHFIINPFAGQDEPIYEYLEKTFANTSIKWSVSEISDDNNATICTQNALKTAPDVIAAYGGDGTMMEVARVLMGQTIPLAIIPGGTANVLAKDLGISTDTQKALSLLKELHTIKPIDMALCNEIPFIIRINVGIPADMVIDVNDQAKNTIGKAAYGISALTSAMTTEAQEYKLTIDGKEVSAKGVALIIANSGNIGTPGFSIVPEINVNDGLLDIIIVENVNPGTVIEAITKTLKNEKPESYNHFQGKEIHCTIPKNQKLLLDDVELKTDTIHVKIKEKAIYVVTSPKE